MWREASLVWRANGTEHRKLKLGEKLENDVWCLKSVHARHGKQGYREEPTKQGWEC